MERKWVIFTALLFASAFSSGGVFASSGITYHGRLLKPDGTPVTSSSVQFRVQIRTPGVQDCLMYEEIQTKDLSLSKGMFSISIGDTSGVRQDSNSWSLFDALSNRQTFSFSASDCVGSNSYTPNPEDNRNFRVFFNLGSGWEAFPTQAINYIPFAVESYRVGGFPATALVRVENAGGALGSISPLNTSQYNEILNLIAGSSSQYEHGGEFNGATLPTFSNGESLRWTGTAWETFTPLASGSESDPTVQAFAKTSLPPCGTGEVLKSNGTVLSCVTDASGSASVWTENSGDIYRATGNVGIGTTNPSEKLQVEGNIKISGTGNGITFSDGTTQTTAATGGGSGDFKADGSVAMTGQFLGADGSQASPGISMASNPDTGFYKFNSSEIALSVDGSRALWTSGSSTPTINAYYLNAAFSVESRRWTTGTNGGYTLPYISSDSSRKEPQAAGAPGSYMENNSGGNGYGTFHRYNVKNSSNTEQYFYAGVISNSSGYSPSYVWGHQDGATSYSEVMRIDSNGNVGIGTTAPSEKLEVNGNIKATQVCIGTDCRSSWPSGGGGSAGLVTSNQSADFTVTTADNGKIFFVTTTGGDVTVTFPTAASAGAGFTVIIKKLTGSGYVNLPKPADCTAAGAYYLGSNYSYVQMVSTGSLWTVINGSAMCTP